MSQPTPSKAASKMSTVSKLPANPLEALSISTALKIVVKIVHSWATLFGSWKRPAKNAAADFENMSLMDKLYWGYKSKNPVMHPEKNLDAKNIFQKDMFQSGEFKTQLPLPDGFVVKDSLSFSAVGDLIKTPGLENSRDRLYDKVGSLIFDADISYANLESQLTPGDVGEYTFSDKETPPLCCTPEQYGALKGHKNKSFTVMHTANNHTYDVGATGLDTTLAQLAKDGITDLGTNREPGQQEQGRVVEIKGFKVGFVSATYGLNGKPVPEGKEFTVNVVKFHSPTPENETVDIGLLEKQTAWCRQQGCDVIVASLHWGYEYETFPRRHQVDIAHRLVEAGVDVVVGHHAHVVQPIEFYRPQRDPQRTAVIAYSLGNLTSSFSAPYLVLSGILNLAFVRGETKGKDGTGRTLIREVRLTPVVQRESVDEGPDALFLETLEDFYDGAGGHPELENHAAAIKAHAEKI